jgi:hypothetical protein
MGKLLISCLTIGGLFLYFCFPAIAAAPFEIVPRIVFYLMYPLAVLLTCAVTVLGSANESIFPAPEENTYSVGNVAPSYL